MVHHCDNAEGEGRHGHRSWLSSMLGVGLAIRVVDARRRGGRCE